MEREETFILEQFASNAQTPMQKVTSSIQNADAIYLFGPARSGKSTLINHFIEAGPYLHYEEH